MHARLNLQPKPKGVMTLRTATCIGLLSLALTVSSSAQQRPRISGVSHLSVYSADASRTEGFYVHDLGAFKAPDPQDPAGVRYYFNPIQFVEVLPLPAASNLETRFDHAGFNTENAEAMRRYLASRGITVPASVTRGSDGSQYFAVQDPEGNRIQFLQPPAKPIALQPGAVSTHMIHVGFVVSDPAAEDAFYAGLLGFRPYWHGGMKDDRADWISEQVPDGTDWLEYMVRKSGDAGAISLETAGVLDHFALGVQNMEKTFNVLYAGDRLTGKHSPPQIGRDGKWQLNLYDPDGTRAELMEFQPSVKPCCSPFLLPSPTK